MMCNSCGHHRLRTIDTRPHDSGTTLRRRECRKCGHLFSTVEVPVPDKRERPPLRDLIPVINGFINAELIREGE